DYKNLILNFDIGNYSPALDKNVILNYLAKMTVISGEIGLTNNAVTIPDHLKIKDLKVFVTKDNESGWMRTRDLDNIESSQREHNEFTKSYPDEPVYRLTDSKIKFEVNDFTCDKIKYEYIKRPVEITEVSDIDFIYMKELQDATVTSLLETLESRRLQSQAVVSKT
ncbi:hypothetical protein LCGC14_2992320, partial [marine sediment metagenome]